MRDSDTIPFSHLGDNHLSEDIESRPAALEVLTGEQQGVVYTLDKILMTGGRLPESEIYIEDQQLSRRHFQIVHDGTSYYLRDARSTNGTFLNERKLDTDSVLINGDVIRVGKTRIKFISGNDPDRVKLDQSVKEITVDKQTGCYTKSYLNIELNRAITRSLSDQTPLCLMIFAIDNHAGILKEYGEGAAEHLLAKSVKRIKDSGIRADDILARYSDDEFILMLEGAPLNRAKEVAQRLMNLFERKAIKYVHGDMETTLSIGLADLKPDMQNSIEFFKNADYAMYEAKRIQGSNLKVFGASSFEPDT